MNFIFQVRIFILLMFYENFFLSAIRFCLASFYKQILPWNHLPRKYITIRILLYEEVELSYFKMRTTMLSYFRRMGDRGTSSSALNYIFSSKLNRLSNKNQTFFTIANTLSLLMINVIICYLKSYKYFQQYSLFLVWLAPLAYPIAQNHLPFFMISFTGHRCLHP